MADAFNAECKNWTSRFLPQEFYETLDIHDDWEAAVTKAKIARLPQAQKQEDTAHKFGRHAETGRLDEIKIRRDREARW